MNYRFTGMNYLLIAVMAVSICISCNKILPGEHATLAFENNSSDTIYVDGGILNKGIDNYSSNTISIGIPKDNCEVAPNSINYNTAPIYSSGVAYSYENVFSKTKTAEKCLVYVVPFYSTENIGDSKPLYEYKLVCYELALEDLITLDYHLYYPPNEKMQHIKMDPPYDYFTTH